MDNLNKMDKKRFDSLIVKTCPNLYRDRNGDKRETLMYWGFDIYPGWHQLVWDLSLKLEKLILGLPESERQNYRAMQVKSKFAGLRYYTTGHTDEMTKLIDEAEALSLKICEFCGEPGKERGKGWVYTLCDKCEQKKEEDYIKRINEGGRD